jgi:hypothetical protein
MLISKSAPQPLMKKTPSGGMKIYRQGFSKKMVEDTVMITTIMADRTMLIVVYKWTGVQLSA